MSRTKVPPRLTYQVVYSPEGTNWKASVPSVPGCHGSGRSLSEVRRRIRDALASCLDGLSEQEAARVAREADLVEEIKLPARTRRSLAACRQKRDRLAKALAEVQTETRRVALELTREIGISLRDAGELLGLSQERVRQLLDQAP
jgi:predicted RNase H-like HicB family nuclease